MKKLYTNWGYDRDLGKNYETWYTLCDSCLAENLDHDADEQIVTEAKPLYEGHVLTCEDCGKTD